MSSLSALFRFLCCASNVFVDALIFFCLTFRSHSALAAENLLLRKQLVLYVERNKKPRRATDAIRFTLAHLARYFEWRDALTVVKPDTLIRWHRKGFRLFWKWKSRSNGRPWVPADVRRLIVEMTTNNPTWGEKRIANELLLKIGIRISPRTVRRYMPEDVRFITGNLRLMKTYPAKGLRREPQCVYLKVDPPSTDGENPKTEEGRFERASSGGTLK